MELNLKTTVGSYLVSTVMVQSFRVLDTVYETMIFRVVNGKVNYTDLYRRTYDTEEAAARGHEDVVACLRDGRLSFKDTNE